MTMRVAKWVVTADARHVRLVRCTLGERGDWHCEQVDTMDNSWEDYHEHGRPDRLTAGKSGGEREGVRVGSRGHQTEEEMNRFARDAAAWLDKAFEANEPPIVDLYAPPKFLGALRKHLSEAGRLRIRDHETDLSQLQVRDLAEHPAVAAILGEGQE